MNYQLTTLILSVLLGSWIGMQMVHELGHILGALCTGGEVEKVVLHPLTISRTDLAHNPRPLIVVWAGPVLGVIIPLLMWLLTRACDLTGTFVFRFFAGFCCIANGVYIALGSFDHIGDCKTMLQHGSYNWHLWLFGAITIPIGLLIWHGQGKHFGLGEGAEPVNRSVAYSSLGVFITLLIIGFVIGE